MLKKVCVIGHFGFGQTLLNGQTVKTKIITAELQEQLGNQNVLKIDTCGGGRNLITLAFKSAIAMITCKNIIIMPANNGLRFFAPLLSYGNKLFKCKLHYIVVGGWLSDYLSYRKSLRSQLKRFDGIYVETDEMKKALENLGFANVSVMPNCKKLTIVSKDSLVYPNGEPYKLCTFSRVMKEKGIENAIEAVTKVNMIAGRIIYTLDIYGEVDTNYYERFERLKKDFPSYISYGGLVPFDKSTPILKNYFALLFPTFYEGEGFAGTIIDAFAAGVPVVATNWKYNTEIIDDKVGYIYSTDRIEELIKVLVVASNNPEIFTRLKINCIERANRYSAKAVVRNFIKYLCVEE